MTTRLTKKAAQFHRYATDFTMAYQAYYHNVLVSHRLTFSQFFALETLAQDPIFMSDLAAQLQVPKSTATRFIDHLVARKLVRRQSQPEDRRSVKIHLTKKGAALLCTIESEIIEQSQKILERVPREMRDDVIRTIKQLAEAIDN